MPGAARVDGRLWYSRRTTTAATGQDCSTRIGGYMHKHNLSVARPRPLCRRGCIASKSKEKRPWIGGWWGSRTLLRPHSPHQLSIPKTRKMPTPSPAPIHCLPPGPAQLGSSLAYCVAYCAGQRAHLSNAHWPGGGALWPTTAVRQRPEIVPVPLRAWPALTSITCFGRAGDQFDE